MFLLQLIESWKPLAFSLIYFLLPSWLSLIIPVLQVALGCSSALAGHLLLLSWYLSSLNLLWFLALSLELYVCGAKLGTAFHIFCALQTCPFSFTKNKGAPISQVLFMPWDAVIEPSYFFLSLLESIRLEHYVHLFKNIKSWGSARSAWLTGLNLCICCRAWCSRVCSSQLLQSKVTFSSEILSLTTVETTFIWNVN